MAHPKRKTSVQRKKKRRTHYKITPKGPSLHMGKWEENQFLYRGKVIIEKPVTKKTKKSS